MALLPERWYRRYRGQGRVLSGLRRTKHKARFNVKIFRFDSILSSSGWIVPPVLNVNDTLCAWTYYTILLNLATLPDFKEEKLSGEPFKHR